MIEKSTYPNPPVLRRSRRPDVQSATQKYQPDAHEAQTASLPRQKRHSWSVPLGMGMLLMILLYLVGITLVLPWTTSQLDHWQSGEGRLTQCDLNVGHHGTSHFLAEYWHQQAIVIEIPQGNPSGAKTYALPILVAGDTLQRTVTLKPLYLSRQPRPGNPDLVVQVEGFAVSPVLYNTGDGFTTEAG